MLKRSSAILGLLVTIYWLLSFAVSLADLRIKTFARDEWWNIGFFSVPGYWLGEKVFSFLEFISGWDYSRILSEEMGIFTVLLIVTAISLGVGSWLFSQLLIGLLIRLQLVKQTMVHDKTLFSERDSDT